MLTLRGAVIVVSLVLLGIIAWLLTRVSLATLMGPLDCHDLGTSRAAG